MSRSGHIDCQDLTACIRPEPTVVTVSPVVRVNPPVLSTPDSSSDLRARTQEITAEYWAARESQSERVAVAQLAIALARAERPAAPEAGGLAGLPPEVRDYIHRQVGLAAIKYGPEEWLSKADPLLVKAAARISRDFASPAPEGEPKPDLPLPPRDTNPGGDGWPRYLDPISGKPVDK